MARIVHLAIKVENLEDATRFYENVFGMHQVGTGYARGHTSRHMSDGALDMALMAYDNEDVHEAQLSGAGPCIHHWGIEVEDRDAVMKAIEENGGTIISDPAEGALKFRAPDGTVAEITRLGRYKKHVPSDQCRVVRLAIRVGDLDKGARFYETVFGFKTVPGAAVANTRRLTDGAFDIVLMKGEGTSSAKHHHIGVKVFDAGAFRDRLARSGASLQPDSGSAFFRAPDGTLTEIVTPMGVGPHKAQATADRRTIIRSLTVLPFAFAIDKAFAADARMPYPVKLVTLVTHSSPGSGSDVFLRQLVKYLERYIAASFIVENDDGGSGAKAVARVAAGRADGSIFYATTPTYILTSLLSKPAKTYRDLDPVVNFFSDAEVLYVRTDAPYRSLDDVIDRARKSRARWGVSNPASMERESAEQLKTAAKVNAAVVSHQGGSQMIINVLNGTLDMGIGEIEEIRPQLEGRKVRLLATFNGERMPSFPDLPTVKELGYDVVREKFRGLAAPKGLSPSIVAIWDEAARKILADPEYKKAYEADNLVPLYLPHDRYRPFVANFAAETERFLKSTRVIQ